MAGFVSNGAAAGLEVEDELDRWSDPGGRGRLRSLRVLEGLSPVVGNPRAIRRESRCFEPGRRRRWRLLLSVLR